MDNKLISVPNLVARVELVQTIIDCAAEPWEGSTNWVEVGRVLGLSPNAVRKQYKRLETWLVTNGFTIQNFVNQVLYLSPEGVEEDPGDGDSAAEEEAEFVRNMGYDPELYTLKPRSVWTVGGKPQRSFVVVPKTTVKTTKTIDDLVAQLAAQLVPHQSGPKNEEPEEHLAVFSLYDAHIGKRTLDGGDMAADYKRAAFDLIGSVGEAGFGRHLRPVLVVGQDFANYDTVLGTTSAGTPQTNSLSWQELITTQIAVITNTVAEFLAAFGSIELHFVAGNHDIMQTFWLRQWAEARYADDVRVSIMGHGDWSALRHGKVGVMVLHGHVGKLQDYINLWSTAAPESWAYSTYREIHTGHLHTRKEVIAESHGVTLRYMPGLTGTDDWHRSKLYMGNTRMGLVTVYNRRGPVAEFYSLV